jgi:cysteinyl-tRNA synthetase, unknown class
MIHHSSSACLLVVAAALASAGALTLAPSLEPSLALPLAGPPVAVGAPPTKIAQQPQSSGAAAERRRRMGAVNNWGYWLSSFEIARVAAAPHDLLVIDSEISANRTFERQFRSEEVRRMKHRPDGSPRVLLAYLSIGEAERYRPYWRQEWYDAAKKPVWLDKENRRWAGNFLVQFWHPEWQQLIFGSPDSYLDRIVAQGFDGVYLDRADAFFQWRKVQPTAASDMATFIARLADHARKQNPEFLVVMQNAEELLEEAPVISAIDGIAKEDLLYGVRRAQEPNKPRDIEWTMQLLHMAQKAERRVLVVEYLKDPEKMAAAATRIIEEGFIPYFAPRKLQCLNPPAVLDASGNLPDHSCR